MIAPRFLAVSFVRLLRLATVRHQFADHMHQYPACNGPSLDSATTNGYGLLFQVIQLFILVSCQVFHFLRLSFVLPIFQQFWDACELGDKS